MAKRKFSEEQILAVVKQLEAGRTAAEMAREVGVSEDWRSIRTCCTGGGERCARAGQCVSWPGETALVGWPGGGTGTEGRSADPGDRFFERVLAAHRGTADATGTGRESAIFRKVKEEVKAGSELTVKRMVKLAQVSRASFYRFDEDAKAGPDPDMDLRDAIQRIALEWPSYGRRRSTAELRRRAGR